MSVEASRSDVGKMLAVLALVVTALAIGRCWGVSSVSAPGTLASAATAWPSLGPSARASASATPPGVEIHWDAGSLKLLPDAQLPIPAMPSLDPEQLLRGEAPDAAARHSDPP